MDKVIKSANSIKNALLYNENKLKQDVAKLIHSMGFAKDTEQVGFTDKMFIQHLKKCIYVMITMYKNHQSYIIEVFVCNCHYFALVKKIMPYKGIRNFIWGCKA